MLVRHALALAHASGLILCGLVLIASPAAADSEAVRQQIVQHLSTTPAGAALRSYRALRRLTASARHDSMTASLDAWTTLDDGGLSYELVREEGSGIIRKRVLRAALAAERELLRSGGGSAGAVSPANYEFLGVTSETDRRARIAIHPRREHTPRSTTSPSDAVTGS